VKKNSVTPWEYRPCAKLRQGTKKPLLYRTPAAAKLVFFILLSVSVFIFGFWFLAAAALILILFSLNARILPWQLLRGSAPLLVLCVGIFIFRAIEFFPPGINTAGLAEGGNFCLRMVISFASGALLFSTVTPGEIQRSLSALDKVPGLQRLRISTGISLMLGFIPAFFRLWEDTETAWISRGGKNNLNRYITLMPLVIEALMEKAAITAAAMESRGFFI